MGLSSSFQCLFLFSLLPAGTFAARQPIARHIHHRAPALTPPAAAGPALFARASNTTIPANVTAPNVDASTLPACQSIQYPFTPGTGSDPEKAAAISDAYRYAFSAYYEYAWNYDELTPLSKNGTNDLFGWHATIVDGLDTAIIMGLTDIVAEILPRIEATDFTTAVGNVALFDGTIRYLGGLLSAYDLLKSGQFYNGYPPDQIEALLTQAIVLADKMAYGFDTPSGISAGSVDFATDTPIYGTYTADNGVTYNSTNTASAGSFLVEWYRLATITGNTTYRELVDKGESYLVNPSPAPIYPGLTGTQFDTDTGKMLNLAGGWHSTVDSFLEYLIKIYHYEADNTTTFYKNYWSEAVNSTEAHLALHPYGFPDLTMISELDDNGVLTYTADDYSCFAGGNFLLGCAVLGVESFCDLGVAWSDGCHQTYNTTTTGLGPLYWGWYDSTNNTFPPDSTYDIDAGYRQNGAKNGEFIIQGNEVYGSFPESLESWFYAHRITGDQRWADYSWEVFQAINATQRNSVAFATVNNVDMPFGGSQTDIMDAFFLAEVLKYLYLQFVDPSVIDLGQWVFNTEGHPVLVQCTSS